MNKPAQGKNNTQTINEGLLNEDFISVSKAADLLGISPTSLRRLEEQGKVKSIRKENGYRFFKKSEILDYKNGVKENKNQTNTQTGENKNKVIQNNNIQNNNCHRLIQIHLTSGYNIHYKLHLHQKIQIYTQHNQYIEIHL